MNKPFSFGVLKNQRAVHTWGGGGGGEGKEEEKKEENRGWWE